MVGMVETMMTADSLQLPAYGFGRMQRWKLAGAVSSRPMALPGTLACESYGLTV